MVSASHSAGRRPGSARPRRMRSRRWSGRGGRTRDQVGDRVPKVADQRLRRAEPHRARAGDGQGVRGRREDGGELAQPAEVGRIERARPPYVRVVGSDRRQQPAPGHQAHARRRGRRPHPGAAAHRPHRVLARIGGEQRGQSLGERNKIRRHQPLADAVSPAGEDQLQLGRSRALAPVREYALPRDLARYEDKLAVQHATVRYRLSGPPCRNFGEGPPALGTHASGRLHRVLIRARCR